jgi:intracellular sulfur oxidation DsrE/DsrF family protein
MKLTQLGRGLAAAALLATSLATIAAPQNRVVLQISDGDAASWNQTINVARNIQSAFGKDNVAVELVVFGNGIGIATFDSPLADRLNESMAAGVEVAVCENTMKARKLKREDMNAKASFVPAGVVELIKKQQEGWAYIKP